MSMSPRKSLLSYPMTMIERGKTWCQALEAGVAEVKPLLTGGDGHGSSGQNNIKVLTGRR